MGELFNDYRRLQKEKHANWYSMNRNEIESSVYQYQYADTNCVLFREHGKPKVDFYLHTGRWKANGKMFRGGAKAFLKWYKKQGEPK